MALDGGSGGSKLVFALGVKELVGAVVVGFRHEDLGGTAQIAVVRRGGSTNACVAAMPCCSSIVTSISALTTGPV